MKNTLIIFDIDGTLASTVGADDDNYRVALKELFNIEFDDDYWLEIKEKTGGTDSAVTEEIFRQKKGNPPESQDIYALKRHFLYKLEKAFSQKKPEEIQGAKKFIESIQSKSGFYAAIATGSWEESGRMKLDAIGIQIEEIPYANAENILMRKDIIKDAADKSKKTYGIVSFDNIIYFGDGIWDLKSARELGIEFVGVDALQTGKLKAEGALNIIKDYSDKESLFKIISSPIRHSF